MRPLSEGQKASWAVELASIVALIGPTLGQESHRDGLGPGAPVGVAVRLQDGGAHLAAALQRRLGGHAVGVQRVDVAA